MKNCIIKIVSNKNKGAVLIGFIVILVIFAILCATVVSLTSTSMFNQLWANSSTRAYYLAESGYRFADREYGTAGRNTSDDILKAMHDSAPYVFGNNDGSFDLSIYPYYLVTSADVSAGATSFSAAIKGGLSAEDPFTFPAGGGRLKVLNNAKGLNEVLTYTSASTAGLNITFIVSALAVSIPEDSYVLPVAESASGQTINKGDSLEFQAGSAGAFPAYNGTVEIGGRFYAYEKRDDDNHLLTRIEDPESDTMAPFSIGAGDDIVLQQFVKLHSTGTYGHGSVEAVRKIIYHVPLPTFQKIEFHDPFEDKSQWETAAKGSHDIETIGSDKVLKVTSTNIVGSGTDEGSLIGFDWSTSNLDLSLAHLLAGGFLSYDAQVKVGCDPAVPATYMPGITFRWPGGANDGSYGVSFLQGDYIGTGAVNDKIPDDLVPPALEDDLGIVLWQYKPGGTPEWQWLAYNTLIPLELFFDDIECNEGGWQKTGWWAQTTNDSHSPDTCWTDSPSGNSIPFSSTAITSEEIETSGLNNVTLSFWHKHDFVFDFGKIYILNDGGLCDPEPLVIYMGSSGGWVKREVDISLCLPSENIQIRFYLTAGLFTGDGWYIDDVLVYSNDFPITINEATLLVRVEEASTVSFTAGPNPIEDGDLISQNSSGASGIVSKAPVFDSVDSWTDGATGIIIVNKLDGVFAAGEALTVNGTASSTNVTDFRLRDNYIKVYHSDTVGAGTPNDNPLDHEKGSISRGTLKWPPDNPDDTEPTNDFFRLVQWEMNCDLDPTDYGDLAIFGAGNELNTIIRTNTYTTDPSATFTDTEVGLHTFGTGVFSTNIFFDDFGIQADMSSTGSDGFGAAVQE